MNLGQIPCIRASIFILRGAQQGRGGRAYKPVWARFGWRGGTKLDQPFSPGLWHKPGLMVMGQGRGALVPVRALNRNQKVQTNRDQWPTWPGRPPGLTNRD